ncbi:hypothetical protein [Thermomonospora umbrina]|nr:hypothetical protein [Thermomonospora umbrina]
MSPRTHPHHAERRPAARRVEFARRELDSLVPLRRRGNGTWA